MQVVSVNISAKKGTVKKPVSSIVIDRNGIVNDAHAGAWHRQVSLLAKESIDKFGPQSGATFNYGDFAENITTAGIDLTRCKIRDRLRIGEVELEVTQIGKECHGDGCAIFREIGKCVMPKEGIFARVLSGGEVRPGDPIEHTPGALRAKIITLSDRASQGAYEDRSGPAIKALINEHFSAGHWRCETESTILPDNAEALQREIANATGDGVDIIITTGGTGIGPRDITPDVVRPMLDREIPGIMEFIRVKYGERIPSALLSRGVAGMIGKTLIYTLPGSVKAVNEYMAEILRTLNHSLLMIMAIDAHAATDQ
jgi:molybdenum cofactor synthesis domain-containing protein